jgi:hypothetical protein
MYYTVTLEIIGKAVNEDESQILSSTTYYVTDKEYEDLAHNLHIRQRK